MRVPALSAVEILNSTTNIVLTDGTTPTANQWNMLTFVHSGERVSYYLNGNFINEVSTSDLNPNTFNFSIGGLVIEAIDELSVFNSELTFLEVYQLYNNGNGLNYSSTNNNTVTQNTTTNICIDEQYLCDNPYFIGGQYYCNYADVSYCELGCINFVYDNTTQTMYESTFDECNTIYQESNFSTWECSLFLSDATFMENWFDITIGEWYNVDCGISTNEFVTTYSSCTDNNINEIVNTNPTNQYIPIGVCAQSGICDNDCNILGSTYSDTMTSFKVCGNYDLDPCLEYSGSFGCNIGEISIDGDCIANTGNGLNDNSAFTVTPYSVSTDNTVYTVDSQKKQITIQTILGV
jgi:hypothetical protein